MMVTSPVSWDDIRLVVFDVDGTLYRQAALRRRMALELALRSLATRDLATLRILKTYRRLRETLAEAEVPNFETELLARTAARERCAQDKVRVAVREWMLERPLPHLPRCRYPGLSKLFAALRRGGWRIGVFSDYPAKSKLDALRLAADWTVSADDPEVGMLKPHPRGLERLIELAGTTPGQTLLIGDRAERDGLAARRAGARPLIRSRRPIEGWLTFRDYRDEVFAAVARESLG